MTGQPRGRVRWQVWAGLLLLLATLTAEWSSPMGSGYAFRCEVCDTHPTWSILRVGDVVCSWACPVDLSEVCNRLQRDHEVTQLVVKHYPKAVEWAEIGEVLRKVGEASGG